MKSFKEFMEAKAKTVVFTFGRMNPPTTGHLKLIKKVMMVLLFLYIVFYIDFIIYNLL